jgi:hypothetical protein
MSTNYKYSLEKGSKKYICPNCGKNTFVRFIDNEKNEYLNEVLGRCDRETNCGYFKSPSSNEIFEIKLRDTKPLTPCYHNKNELLKSLNSGTINNFNGFLYSRFDEKIVSEALLKYYVGACSEWNNATVFWQIDENDLIHGGKAIIYNKSTGKRSKGINTNSLINWMHKINKQEDFQLSQCLFGLHQIKEKENITIGMVESEKTAVILSILLPEYIWMATGSKTGFKEDMLMPIRRFRIVAFPDKSEFQYWSSKGFEMNRKGFNITVNDWLEKSDFETGTDLADLIIELNKSK